MWRPRGHGKNPAGDSPATTQTRTTQPATTSHIGGPALIFVK